MKLYRLVLWGFIFSITPDGYSQYIAVAPLNNSVTELDVTLKNLEKFDSKLYVVLPDDKVVVGAYAGVLKKNKAIAVQNNATYSKMTKQQSDLIAISVYDYHGIEQITMNHKMLSDEMNSKIASILDNSISAHNFMKQMDVLKPGTYALYNKVHGHIEYYKNNKMTYAYEPFDNIVASNLAKFIDYDKSVVESHKNWSDFALFTGVSLNKNGAINLIIQYNKNYLNKDKAAVYEYAVMQFDQDNNFQKIYDLPILLSSTWGNDFLLHQDETMVVVEKSEDGKLLNHHYLVKSNGKFVVKPNLPLEQTPQYLSKYKSNLMFKNHFAYPYIGSQYSNVVYNLNNGKSLQVLSTSDYDKYLNAKEEDRKASLFTIKSIKLDELSGALLVTYIFDNQHFLNVYNENGNLQSKMVLNDVMPLVDGEVVEYVIDNKRKLLIQNYKQDKYMKSNMLGLDLVVNSKIGI